LLGTISPIEALGDDNLNANWNEGIVKYKRADLRIGQRYDFLPRHCMLQSRHSGLVNTITRTKDGTMVRIEGIRID
jgi:uncharacterized Fe-S cluster-containing protein